VRFLLEKGAQVDAAGGKSGKTALIRASDQGYVHVLELLIMAGADVNAASKVAGKTALMGAIEHENPDAAVLLMKSGADFQARDKKGRTVEDIAAQCGRRDWLDDLRGRETRFTSHIPPQDAPPQPSEDDWYAILDSKKTDSPDQIKAKYHALMKQYHPDMVRAKGMPEDFLKLAHEKSLQIQEAYSKIMTKK
jgi:DnaJ-domain-containing protein 1